MSGQLAPRDRANGQSTAYVGLTTLLSRLNQDATSLIRDELELAKLEVRDVANAVASDVHDAKTTLVKDLTKVGVALAFALLAGMALTAAAIMGVGVLVGAYWAGALIVGVVLLVAAVIFGKSAGDDMKSSDALRFERTRSTLQHDKQVLKEEALETKDFVQREAREFKENVTN
jgi:uncharacterized membrane protein YqjE